MSSVCTGRPNAGPCMLFLVDAEIYKRPGKFPSLLVTRKPLTRYLISRVPKPPWYDADLNATCLEHSNQVLRLFRNKYDNPYIKLAGDMNRRYYKKATSGFPDMQPILTNPTQGRHVLDLIVTNFNELLEQAIVTDSIENDEGLSLIHI